MRKSNKREKAIEKFGYILTTSEINSIRKFIYDNNPPFQGALEMYKMKKYQNLYIMCYWSRSIVGSDFDLNHPGFKEYKDHFQIGDVDWLIKGSTYVDIKLYKKYKRNQEKNKRR